MTLLKKTYQGSKNQKKKSVWTRITGEKGKSISESYRMQNNGLLNNIKGILIIYNKGSLCKF